MTFCRANVSVATVNDRLWAVGGFNGKDFLKTVEFLDPNSDEWTNILTIEEKSESKDEISLEEEVVAENEEFVEEPRDSGYVLRFYLSKILTFNYHSNSPLSIKAFFFEKRVIYSHVHWYDIALNISERVTHNC